MIPISTGRDPKKAKGPPQGQLLIAQFFAPVPPRRNPHRSPLTKELTSIKPQNNIKQTKLTNFYCNTPPHLSPSTPPTPKKRPHLRSYTAPPLTLENLFVTPPKKTQSKTHTSVSTHYKQPTPHHFFFRHRLQPSHMDSQVNVNNSPTSPSTPGSRQLQPAQQKQNARRPLQYTLCPKQLQMPQFTTPYPSYDRNESWGHSLDTIDASSIFRVFLQNPNGLALHAHNYSLIQVFKTCFNYGAAVILLPETKPNWNHPEQRGMPAYNFKEHLG
jgi:hypothetical protein